MSPERLKGDAKILVEVLETIWRRQARRVIGTVWVTTALALGLVIGTLWAARVNLANTRGVMTGLQEEVRINRAMVGQLAHDKEIEQRRYQVILQAFEALVGRVDHQPKARPGDRGPRGARGITGAKGARGITGARGPTGQAAPRVTGAPWGDPNRVSEGKHP